MSEPYEPRWKDHFAVAGICIAAVAVIVYYRASRVVRRAMSLIF